MFIMEVPVHGLDGADIFFARNHIHNVGIYYPSAVGLSCGGEPVIIYIVMRSMMYLTPE